MEITPLGVDYDSNESLFGAVDERDFSKTLTEEKEETGKSMGKSARLVEKGKIPEGWTYLISRNDPQKASLENAIKKLIEHRELEDLPIFYDSNLEEADWDVWISQNYYNNEGRPRDSNPPKYVLIIGDPKYIPFDFQSKLSIHAVVGRLDLSPGDLEKYSKKIVKFETSKQKVNKKAIVFAPDWEIRNGKWDATHYSHLKMARPIAEKLKEKNIEVTELMFKNATKKNLIKSFKEIKSPAIVYAASHGTFPASSRNLSLDEQIKRTGAICCQDRVNDPKALFSAEDVPEDEEFLKGSIFFLFSCFG